MYFTENYALNKTAYQSSEISMANSGPHNAVDGIALEATSVAQTSAETGEWWRVDLGELRRIYTIALYADVNGMHL